MALELAALCIDAHDPMLLARFWAGALRWEIGEVTDEYVSLAPTDGTRFGIDIARVPGLSPKAAPNRYHLDLTTSSLDDQQGSVATLLELGGRHLDIGQRPEEDHVVLADPEGNELCLIGPGNRFLEGCPRLGALSGDGREEVGHFWSAALGWPLVWDQDGETAIRAPDGTGPKITWGGPPVAPKLGKARWHLDVRPTDGADRAAEVARLETLGACCVDIGQGDVDWVVMADPDGNELCVLQPA